MWLDLFAPADVKKLLHRCLAANAWVDALQAKQPFRTTQELHTLAEQAYAQLSDADRLQAMKDHPRLGVLQGANAWSRQEQAGMSVIDADTRDRLQSLNDEYEKKFGFVFLLNATGKTSAEVLGKLEQRLPHDAAEELQLASEELRQIMRIRLDKLLAERGPITTHVLDQALGKPAAGIAVTLAKQAGGDWQTLATRRTDNDGRIGHFLPPGTPPEVGVYRLHFDLGTTHFFPFVDLAFHLTQPEQHHHVPLLLSPFGYATYRGS